MSPARVWMITGTSSSEEDLRAPFEHDELAAFAIRTLIVEPGALRPGLLRPGAAIESAELPAYADVAGPTRAYVRANDGAQPGHPELDARQAGGRDTAVPGA